MGWEERVRIGEKKDENGKGERFRLRAHKQRSCISGIVLEMYVRCRIEECVGIGAGVKWPEKEERTCPPHGVLLKRKGGINKHSRRPRH